MGKSIDINAHLVENHAEGDCSDHENGYEEQVPDPSHCAQLCVLFLSVNV